MIIRLLSRVHRRLTVIGPLMVLTCLALSTPACNTTKGVGKDVKELGKSVEESADKHGAD